MICEVIRVCDGVAHPHSRLDGTAVGLGEDGGHTTKDATTEAHDPSLQVVPTGLALLLRGGGWGANNSTGLIDQEMWRMCVRVYASVCV